MSILCPQCGAPAQEGAAKCEYCGASIAQPVQPVQPVQQAQPQQPVVIVQQNVQQPPVNPERANWPIKSKIVAAILALILGGLGIHKFYLGQSGKGILYLVFCWTYIPGILAFIEGIMILCGNINKDAKGNPLGD
jgi:TM2 domain-containing membrane protein YozV